MQHPRRFSAIHALPVMTDPQGSFASGSGMREVMPGIRSGRSSKNANLWSASNGVNGEISLLTSDPPPVTADA